MFQEIKLGIGDICVSVHSADEKIGFEVDENYTAFLTSVEPEVMLRLHYGDMPSISLGKKLFGARGLWGIYDYNGRRFFKYPDIPIPVRLAGFSRDFKTGEIYIRPSNPERRKIFPLVHPLCQVLYVILLSFGRGLLIHSSGIIYKGRGFLFVGESEAGKTTMSYLWNKMEGAEILNDDRVIIRKAEKGYRIYGTPWLGQGRFSSNSSAPLEKIFFLRHSKKNTLTRIDTLNIISRIYARSRLPHWDKQGLSSSLKFMEEISQRVPSLELGFLPDESVIDFILNS